MNVNRKICIDDDQMANNNFNGFKKTETKFLKAKV